VGPSKESGKAKDVIQGKNTVFLDTKEREEKRGNGLAKAGVPMRGVRP